jgi:hypothetical protein
MTKRWIALSLLSGGLTGGTAHADHEAATPRSVVEKQLGPLRIASQLPAEFSGCKTHTKGFPEEEYLAFFDLPDDPTNSVALSVIVDCLDDTNQPVACDPSRPRYVKFLSITKHPYKPERVDPRCKLPLPPKDFSTSRGVALGDSIQKVLSRYGPASVNNRAAKSGSRNL